MRTINIARTKLDAVERELRGVSLAMVPAGAGRARGPGTTEGWIDGLSMVRLVEARGTNRLIEFPAIASAVGRLMKLRHVSSIYQVMVSQLEPGGTLDKHRDGIEVEPAPERWHLPIVTNPGVEYWDNLNGMIVMVRGWWWGPVPYYLLHSMVNAGDQPRTHLIVDLR